MTLPYKMEGPKDLQNRSLLFWPNNPRLKISDFEGVKYSSAQLVSKSVQEKIFHLLCTNEHEVPKLAKSMFQSGFMREKAPIVLKIGGRDRFLVLEGNRRLAASRLILRSKGQVDPQVRKSLENIPCWLFTHTSSTVPLAAAISRMVAEAHIKGQKPHTKIQQAHMLYDAYVGFLNEAGFLKFVKQRDLIKKGAEFFELGETEFEQEIAVFRLFQQLIRARYSVEHNIREKLTWVYKNPRHFARNFGYSAKFFIMDSAGMERYYELFVRNGCAVSSPAMFKKFQNIMRYGKSADIEILRTKPEEILNIEKAILDSRQDARFLKALQNIERQIGGLKLHEFGDSEEERHLIESIRRLVEERLHKLLSRDATNCESARDACSIQPSSVPTNVDDAVGIPYSRLSLAIQKVLVAKPNTSCVRSKVPAILLKTWSIRTRGRPRQKFAKYIDGVIEQMVSEGRIIAYRVKNARIKLADKG